MKRRLDPCREDVFRIVQWTTETPKQQKLLERSGANVTDVTPSGAYLTLDNGARPFKVEVEWSDDRASVLVFKKLQEDCLKHEEVECVSFSAENVFVGQCPARGSVHEGNSMLLHLEGLQYAFIGFMVFSFTAKSTITKFVSRVGFSDVPYPWAMDEEGYRYLFIEDVILANKLVAFEDTNPYDMYYNGRTRNLTAQAFQGVTGFFINEQEYNLTYYPDPEQTYDRLANLNIGEFFLEKGPQGEKIKITKADYMQLMHDFAHYTGFEKLEKTVIVERLVWQRTT